MASATADRQRFAARGIGTTIAYEILAEKSDAIEIRVIEPVPVHPRHTSCMPPAGPPAKHRNRGRFADAAVRPAP